MSGNEQEFAHAAQDGQGDDFHAAVAAFASDKDAPAQADGEQSDHNEIAPPVEPEPSSANAEGPQPAAGQEAPEGTPSEDIWANASEEQRRHWERIQQDLQKAQQTIASLKGRVSATDRRLFEITSQSIQPSTGRDNQLEAGAGGKRKTAREILKSEEIGRFKDEYPEIASPILDALEVLAEGQEQLSAPVAAMAATHAHSNEQARIQAYSESHPDWRHWAHDPRWSDWLSEQPRALREAHARNLNIEDPHEAAWVLSEFKKWGRQPLAADGSPIELQATPQSNASQPAANPAGSLAAKRNRQLDAGRDGGSSGSQSGATGVPDDFSAAAAAFARDKDRKYQNANRI